MYNIIGKGVVDLGFSNPTLVKSNNENHQILMCDTIPLKNRLDSLITKYEDKIKRILQGCTMYMYCTLQFDIPSPPKKNFWL